MATRPSGYTATASLTAAATSRSTGSESAARAWARRSIWATARSKQFTPFPLERIALADVEARVGTATVASGDLTLNDPFKANAALLAHLSALQIDLAALKARLDTAHSLPKPLAWLGAALVSGQVMVEGATYQAEIKDLGWSAAAISNALQASVRLAP